MTLTPLEQELVNIADLVLNTVGTLAASKNPAYASLITLGTSLANEVTAQITPGATALSSTIPTDVAASIQPVTTALKTVQNSNSTAAVKAGAIEAVVGVVVTIGEDIFHLFKPAAKVVPTTQPPV